MKVNSSAIVLVVAVFAASAVEMVEALTIVVAAGVSRGWRSALEGVAAGVAVLAVLVAALGPALVHWVPLDALRAVVGTILLVFGLQWLRKAVLRATGYKAKHDENAIFAREVQQLNQAGPRRSGRDPAGFAVAFKGVFLEGLEVVDHRVDPGQHRPRGGSGGRRRPGGRPGGRRGGPGGGPTAGRGPGERHEDAGRPDARQLRELLEPEKVSASTGPAATWLCLSCRGVRRRHVVLVRALNAQRSRQRAQIEGVGGCQPGLMAPPGPVRLRPGPAPARWPGRFGGSGPSVASGGIFSSVTRPSCSSPCSSSVGITALLTANVSTVAAWVTMPVLVIAALTLSVLRGRRTG